MKKEKMKSDIEFYVCNHHRDGSDNCADRGAKELTDKLKKWSKEHHGKKIKIYRSGCLGQCSDGIAIACYPEKKLLLKVSPEDHKEIKQGLEEALKNL